MPVEQDVQWLQEWYAAQCNGEWEHTRGVTIESLDNPGWLLTVDLVETPLAKAEMTPVRERGGDDDWLECDIVAGQFRAAGDPAKLMRLFGAFRKFVESQQPTAEPVITP